MAKINANMRNGVLFCIIGGEEIELILPPEWPPSQEEPDAEDDDSTPSKGVSEAHARALFAGAPALRAAFGITDETPGSDRYERRFAIYCQRAMNRHATKAEIAEAEEMYFESECAKTFAANTGSTSDRAISGNLTPPREPTPSELSAAMDSAEAAAKKRFAEDRQARALFGLLDGTPQDSFAYADALRRFVAVSRTQAMDDLRNNRKTN